MIFTQWERMAVAYMCLCTHESVSQEKWTNFSLDWSPRVHRTLAVHSHMREHQARDPSSRYTMLRFYDLTLVSDSRVSHSHFMSRQRIGVTDAPAQAIGGEGEREGVGRAVGDRGSVCEREWVPSL